MWRRRLSRLAAFSCLGLTCALEACTGSGATGTAGRAASPRFDTTDLTAWQREEWSGLLRTLLAPCPKVPLTLGECLERSSACGACEPAATFVLAQVTQGKTPAQVEQVYRLRFAPEGVKSVPTDDSPSLGPTDAAVTLVEWADFQCPHCADAAEVIEKLLKRHAGRLRVVFKQHPLNGHEVAPFAARAVLAARAQGKFWELHRALFLHHRELSEEKVMDLAKSVGLDPVRLATDMEGTAVKNEVLRDEREADQLGFAGTPFLWVNGRQFIVEHFSVATDLEPWIELELALAPKPGTAAASSSAGAPR